jgi:hypothetical protein
MKFCIRRVSRDVDPPARRAYLLAMKRSTPSPEGSTTMFHSRTLRIVILAAGILAFSASAAQARPLGLGYTDHSQSQSPLQMQLKPQISPHDGAYARWANARGFLVMSQAVDPPNAQQLPVGVTRAQAVPASDSGFNWTAILLGAGILAALMLLAAAATSHVKPERVVQA